MTIGERILKLIKEKGMTQMEFSNKTGIPQSTISTWRAKDQVPRMDKLWLICDTLEVDPYYLLSETQAECKKKQDILVVYEEDEQKLIIEYRSLDKRKKDRLIGYIQALKEN